jgi:hypothetical protein
VVISKVRRLTMSVEDLKSLARKHWTKWLPAKVASLRETGELNEALQGAATLAQTEIEALMKQGYQETEAREVVLPKLILLPPEADAEMSAEERAEHAAAEAEYQKHPPVPADDPEENFPVR